MNISNMNLEDFQMLAALTNAAAAAQQQQQAAAAFASLTAQQNASHYSRQSTPPISATSSPKVSNSTNNTRTPTPTQNGVPQVNLNAFFWCRLNYKMIYFFRAAPWILNPKANTNSYWPSSRR